MGLILLKMARPTKDSAAVNPLTLIRWPEPGRLPNVLNADTSLNPES